MKLTLIQIKEIFLDIIQENKSFEEAGIWASQMIEKDEVGELELNPYEDVAKIFSALSYLAGLRTEVSPHIYLYSVEDVKNEYNFLFSGID